LKFYFGFFLDYAKYEGGIVIQKTNSLIISSLQSSFFIFVGFISTFFLIILFQPCDSFAEGFRVLNQSASATGQGTAFMAQADDASAIHYNPAGITQLSGVQLSTGGLIIGGGTSYKSFTGQKVDGDLSGKIAYPPPSSFYITANLKDIGMDTFDGLTVGFGVTSPFGLIIRYPENSPFATEATSAALPLIDLKPTLAYKFNEMFSFGFGVDIYTFFDFLGEGGLEQHRNAGADFGALGIALNTPLEFNGTDTAVGINLSLLFTPLRNSESKPVLNFGLVHRSQVTLDIKGEFISNGVLFADIVSSKMNLPEIWSAGLAYWPVRDPQHEWKVEFDVDFVDWSTFENLDAKLSNGVTLPFPEYFDSVFVFMLGTEFKWLHPASYPGWELALRGGIVHSQTPIPDITFNPSLPDADYNAYSIGTGFSCSKSGSFFGLFNCGDNNWGKSIGIDIAYQAVAYNSRTINRANKTVVNGTWDTFYHVGSISLRAEF
jgi:long-chain fatty acid transport protein